MAPVDTFGTQLGLGMAAYGYWVISKSMVQPMLISREYNTGFHHYITYLLLFCVYKVKTHMIDYAYIRYTHINTFSYYNYE